MKNLIVLLLVLFSFGQFNAEASSGFEYGEVGVCPSKYCFKVGILFGGSSSSVNFCCSFNSGSYSVHCGFEREIVPNVAFEERMYLEDWKSLVTDVKSDSRSGSSSGYTVHVIENTSVDFLETDEYEVYLLKGMYRLTKEGVVVCSFKKVMKQ